MENKENYTFIIWITDHSTYKLWSKSVDRFKSYLTSMPHVTMKLGKSNYLFQFCLRYIMQGWWKFKFFRDIYNIQSCSLKNGVKVTTIQYPHTWPTDLAIYASLVKIQNLLPYFSGYKTGVSSL